ncbi:MAG: PQQ-dependent sugar dehydrogenase [Planctomyces sp.]
MLLPFLPRTAHSLAILCLLFSGAAATAFQQSADPTRFELTELVRGLVQPMELSVGPDGTVWLIEIAGKLHRLPPGSSQLQLAGELKVTTEQENGLIGMALDPRFAETGWIYLQYSPPDYPGQHISRFTIVDGRLDPASEKLLLKFEEQRKECCHHAGSLHFGPRGELFIATGDNTHPHGDSQGYAPIDERPEKAPWDAQKSSANTSSYSGKILRIRPTAEGGYEIPEGNLFPADGSAGRPEIYAMGCRNPWRMTVDQKTGYVYWGEVGPDAGGDSPRGPRGYDEVNQARQAGNFGWPYFIANNQAYADFDYVTGVAGAKYDAAGPTNESPNNTGVKVLPPAVPAFIYYPYGDSAEFPALGSGGRSACAGPVYYYDEQLPSAVKFPAELNHTLLIYEWTRNWIKLVHLDEQDRIVKIEPFMPQQKFVRPIDMQFGPEGALYLLEYGETWGVNADARLVRIDYIRGNRPPVAVAAVQNNIGQVPLKVRLSGKGTYDRDGEETLTYQWRLISAADAQAAPQVLGSGLEIEAEITVPGVYTAELVVQDTGGASRTATVPVLAGNGVPELRFVHPQSGDFFDPTQPIPYQLLVQDAEDGTNDEQQIESGSGQPLDPEGPGRASVNAVFLTGPVPQAGAPAADDLTAPIGLKRMKNSDCFNCHAVDQKRVGPMLLDIANKYRGVEGALEASVQRVQKGSTGVWGKIPMIPHSHNTVDELRDMVGWIYSLEPAGLVRVFQGFAGEIPVSAEEAAKSGYYRLEAIYADRGAGTVPSLTAATTVYLRQRLVEAELADEVRGPQILNSGNASGGRFIGAINHGHLLRFSGVQLDQVGAMKLKIASAGAGGAIEIRLDSAEGELLASVPVEVNGQWEQFYERTVSAGEHSGRRDLFIRFTHPQQAGGLMNLDSIEFLPRVVQAVSGSR